MEDLKKIKELIEESDNIVFFGGAGVSTESKIPDFRSQDGTYSNKYSDYSPEEILSQEFFYNKTEEFYKFYREKMIYKDSMPNKAHKALNYLEEKNKLKVIITQNIDGLHQKAGSKNIIELHGSVYKNNCINCGEYHDLNYIINSRPLPRCNKCNRIVKPNVVLYGESLNTRAIDEAIKYIREADILIVAGTSLTVYPAAGLIRYYRGKKLILINKSVTDFDNIANYIIRDKVGEVLEKVVY